MNSVNVLLLGASGIPGRHILLSLLKLQHSYDVKITVLKRSGHDSKVAETTRYSTVFLDDFSNIGAFSQMLGVVKPHIIISALNAEPAPILDNHVVDAISYYQSSQELTDDDLILFINGYTLDLLHPSVSELPSSAQQAIEPKTDFASRLHDLAAHGKLRYCTIVNAAFLDYCLVKGYSAINFDKQTTTLVDGGTTEITGCSLAFVGDVVGLVVKYHAFGSETQGTQVHNKRLRVAETTYSGISLTECVQKITGQTFEVKHETSKDILAQNKVIRYLNWAGAGASDFSQDGFEFGQEDLTRRSLDDICQMALNAGLQVYEGIGR